MKINKRIGPMALPGSQSGAVLVIALVILVVISILGVANMQSSTQELKMATSHQDRDVAFAAAEAGLVMAEEWLEANKPARSQLWNSCGSGASCFDASCSGGLCFDGSFSSSSTEYDCSVTTGSATTQRVHFWKDSSLNVWQDAGKHRAVSITGINEQVKYIVEFLCFVAPDEITLFDSSSTNANSGEPLYRITAFAEGNGARANVMLQSTYLIVE